MSTISEYANKKGIIDAGEISTLEGFFQNPEIVGELQEVEKYRKKRYMWLVPSIILTAIVVTYIGSLGIFFVEIGDTGNYRPSDTTDGVFWSIFAVFIVTSAIIAIFRSKIEGAVKQKILTKLSKEIYSKLEYDEGAKYAFGDIEELVKKGFLNSYETIDTIEDSLGFSVSENGRHFVVQGYELETSKTTRDSKGRSRRTVTNHCYLLKARFPSARIALKNDLFIKTDEADGILNGSLWFAFIGAITGGFIGGFLLDIYGVFIVGIIFAAVAYIWRRIYINKKRVKLENITFEKYFDVQCEDQIGSRMIVTPAFMDRLVSLAEKSKYKYELMYRENCFYIKWSIQSGYLEINTWKNMTTNLTTFLDWYIQMKEIIGFIFDMRMVYYSKTETGFIVSDNPPEYETMSNYTPRGKGGDLSKISLFGIGRLFSALQKKAGQN